MPLPMARVGKHVTRRCGSCDVWVSQTIGLDIVARSLLDGSMQYAAQNSLSAYAVPKSVVATDAASGQWLQPSGPNTDHLGDQGDGRGAQAAPPTLDTYAATLQQRLGVHVSPPTCEDARLAGLCELSVYHGHKSPTCRQRIDVSRGGFLQLCPQVPLGSGSYAKVVPAWVIGPMSTGWPDELELVAVKKCRLARLRRALWPEHSVGADPQRVAQVGKDEAMRERHFALLACSPAAPYRAVITDKQTYLLMPLYATSLTEVIPTLSGVCIWSWTWGTYLLEQLVPQVRRAHDNQVVHHDLSIANILLRGHDFALSDFGIARCANEPCTHFLHGTAYCSAPEALATSQHYSSDPRCNEIFALGCIALIVGAGAAGTRLYDALVAWSCHVDANRFYDAYAAGWPSYCAGQQRPSSAKLAAGIFTLYTAALAAWPLQVQSQLLGLMQADPQARLSALAHWQSPFLSLRQRHSIVVHLDRLSAAHAQALAQSLLPHLP